jgi:hypothetical protein
MEMVRASRSFNTLLRISLLVALLASSSSKLFAGDVLRLSGIVTDQTGAVIANAKVSVDNSGIGLQTTIETDSQGWYELLLPAGSYRVEVTAIGFRVFSRDGLVLGPTASLRTDVTLQLETESETVEVTTSGVQMDSAATQLGEGISQEKMTAVPLNGRSFTDLLGLQAGVIPQSSKQSNAVVMSGCTSTPPSGDLNPGDMSVSGQRETANGFTVNGSSVEEDFNNAASVLPNLDSIAEFRVLTSNFDSEFGNFSGGQVLVATKTGTNQLHGSAFEFFRNTNVDATNYLGRERAAYDRHQYGGTAGAPVLRDQLFFFADYQGTRMTQGVETGRIAVPSLANRSGDLANLASQLSGKVSGDYLAALLSNRLGRAVRTGEPYYTPACEGNACVFPGGVIPESA